MSIDVVKELDRIMQADQHDPFQVLGYHCIDHEPQSVVVRTFQPHAESIRLLVQGKRLDMYKMREEGLFEIITELFEPFEYSFEVTTYNKQTRVCKDPYQFLPLMTEFDRHLFNHGTFYKAYEKLGAHPETVNGITGTVFRVWAPTARRVSIIGDFNYWDGRVHQMRVLGGSGIWELFIPGVESGDVYKYEIRTASGDIVEKSDPYQFFSELRPKSASVVWDLAPYSWGDDSWMTERGKTPPYNRPISIYEVHLGSWQRDPASPDRFLSFRELADKLIPYAREMGFTHLELMPIMEHPLDESWGYQVTGYYAVTSRFGTPQDFMYFVDQCHQNGIGVILDWVPSHFAPDGHSLGRFDGSALYEHDDPRQGAHPEWGSLIFNYGRNEIKTFLIANALFWMDKYHVDGLRVDAVASMLYLDYARKAHEWIPNPYGGKENIEAIEFLRHMNSVAFEQFPNVMMVAEESTSFYGVSRPANLGGIGFGFKWNMGWMNDTLDYMSRDPLYRKYHHNNLTFSLLYAFTENFILPFSHDEVVHGKRSLIDKMPGDRWQKFANLRLLFFFMWTHPGKKLLFMGGEIAQYSEWWCKVSLDWHLVEQDEMHRSIQRFVRELNHLYRATAALWEMDFSHEGFRWMDFRDVDRSIISFVRYGKDPKDHVVCLLNFTPQVYNDYKLGVPENCGYQEMLSSDNALYGGSNIHNPDRKHPVREAYGDAAQHIVVNVPPLAGLLFHPVR